MSLYGRIIDLQKLLQAWERVKKNKPACGVDHVTWEQFDADAKELLKEVNTELREHRYECLPVKTVTLYKGEKAREIALYSMRDKVVQQSAVNELTKIFEPMLSKAAFAYRPNKAALDAVGVIEANVKSGRFTHFLKTDITGFFDNILWNNLECILRPILNDEDALDLLRQSVLARMLGKDGELTEKKRGIHQGSSLAPVLSNVYLKEFDYAMEERAECYARYADDIIVLGRDVDDLGKILIEMQNRFAKLGLTVSEKKTRIGAIRDGFEYLGYAFNDTGKGITQKAEEQLGERLETAWILQRNEPVEERLAKLSEILNGWEQYFRGERQMSGILEYAAVAYMIRGKMPIQELANTRPLFHNEYEELARYLLEIWKENRYPGLEIFEVEDVLGLRQAGETINVADLRQGNYELLLCLRSALKERSKENYTELMQKYADLHKYAKASRVGEILANMEEKAAESLKIQKCLPSETEHVPVLSEDEMERFANLFCGREDMYVKIDFVEGRKNTTPQYSPLTDEIVRKHLSGEITAATIVQRPNGTSKYFVLDVDVSRKVLLEAREEPVKFDEALMEAAKVTRTLFTFFSEKGFRPRLEFSGGRGYHLWLFFEEWVPVRYLNMLQDKVEADCRPKTDCVTVEFFPNKVRLKPGSNGQSIKLPLGIANAKGRRSVLLEDDFSTCGSLLAWLDNTPKYSLEKLKRFLALPTESKASTVPREVNKDLSIFGELGPNCRSVLEKCSLMRFLARKAHDSGYLTHFERQSLLYVFAHLGDEGKEFVHKLMGMTMNYQYEVTEKFIRKCPEKPISCVKLREQYKAVTAEFGCSCVFKQRKNCYPSPVLHALVQSQEDSANVTIPISRTLTEEKKQEISEELSIHKRASAAVAKIVEYKKQIRHLDQNVRKMERELEAIFDSEKIESLELDIGILVPVKKEGGYDWRIEI